jgi:hypothetical protein
MPRRKQVSDSPSDQEEFKSQLIGTSPEAIENEMIALAYKEVEYRIRNHQASSQELVHFLKMGSEKERLEREKLEAEMQLQKVKADAIESSKHMEELYENAINAMKVYSGAEEG